MTDVVAYLEAVVGADISSFRRGMAEVRGELEETAGLGTGLVNLGQALTLGLTLPIVAIGVAATAAFTSFDAGMRNINSIMQLPEAQFDKLSEQVLKFGENTRQGATVAAQALYAIVSAGFGVNDTAQAMQLLAVASKTAEAGLADESAVAQLLAQTLLAYGASADQAQHFADVLTQTVNLGVGTMDDFQSAFANVISTAALMKVQFSDLGGTLAFLTQRGMSASEAGTSLNQILTQLLKPTDDMKTAFAALGVSSGTDLINKFGGLQGALKALIDYAHGDASALATLFTNVRALRGVADVANDFGAFSDLLGQFGDTLDGVTGRAQQQQMMSLASQFDYLKSKVQGFLIDAGKAIEPILTPAIKTLNGFFDSLNKLTPEQLQNLVQLGIILAGIPILIIGIGIALNNLPIVAIIGALLLLKQAWDTNFLGIQDSVKDALPAIDKALNDIHLAIITFGTNIAQTWFDIKSSFNAIFGDDFTSLIHDVFTGNWQGALDDVSRIWTKLYNLFEGYVVKPITDFANDTVIPDLKQALGDMIAAINPDVVTHLATAFLLLGGALTFMGISAALNAVGGALVGIGLAIATYGIPGVLSIIATNLSAIAVAAWAFIATPLGVVVLGIAAGFLIWDNNIGGVQDRFAQLIDTLKKDMVTLEQIAFLIDYVTGNKNGMMSEMNALGIPIPAGMDTSGTTSSSGGGGSAGFGAGGVSAPIETPGSWLPLPPPMPGGAGFNYGNQLTGYGASTQHNTINITTQDADKLLNDLRARGIDLRKRT